MTHILSSLPAYDFDAFELSELTGGHPLAYMAVVVFSKVRIVCVWVCVCVRCERERMRV